LVFRTLSSFAALALIRVPNPHLEIQCNKNAKTKFIHFLKKNAAGFRFTNKKKKKKNKKKNQQKKNKKQTKKKKKKQKQKKNKQS